MANFHRLILLFITGLIIGGFSAAIHAEVISATASPASPVVHGYLHTPNGYLTRPFYFYRNGQTACTLGHPVGGYVFTPKSPIGDGNCICPTEGPACPYNGYNAGVKGADSCVQDGQDTLAGSCVVYTCPTGQNWTLDGATCFRPDCGLDELRDPATGICQNSCISKAGQTLSSGYYDWGTSPDANVMIVCDGKCTASFSGTGAAARSLKDSVWHYYAKGNYSFDGGKCTTPSTTGLGSVGSPPPNACSAGQTLGNFNGSAMCVSPGGVPVNPNAQGGGSAPPSETTSNPDGSTTRVDRSPQPDGSTIVKTTTTHADGSKTTSITSDPAPQPTSTKTTTTDPTTGKITDTTTTTKSNGETTTVEKVTDPATGTETTKETTTAPPGTDPIEDYCSKNPNAGMCKTPNKFCEDNPDLSICKTTNWSGSCSGFTCDGDAIQCAISREQHERNCTLFDTATPLSDLGNSVAAGTDDGATNNPALVANREIVSIPGVLDQTKSIAAVCMADVVFSVRGESITIPFSDLCPYIEFMGSIVLAFSLFAGARIVAGGVA